FFQAEDGIRDGHVTGVQTCALPIFQLSVLRPVQRPRQTHARIAGGDCSPVSLQPSPIQIPVPESRKPAQAGPHTHFRPRNILASGREYSNPRACRILFYKRLRRIAICHYSSFATAFSSTSPSALIPASR